MYFKVFDRYIIKEISISFFILLLIAISVMTSGNMIKLSEFIINKGVSFGVVFKLMMYLTPYIISFCVPISFLIAVLFTYNRLSIDNEITALKASGISFYKIISPVIYLSITISVISFYFNNNIVPEFSFKMRNLLINIGYEKPEALIEPGKFINFFNNYIFYFKSMEGSELKNITIFDMTNPKTVRTITAESGKIEKNTKSGVLILKLFNGAAEEPDGTKFYKLKFKIFPIILKMNNETRLIKSKSKSLGEMNLKELKAEIAQTDKTGEDLNDLKAEYHRKIAFSFASFFIVLIGLPLALFSKKKEKTASFGIALILIVAYYLLLTLGEVIAEQGLIYPVIAMWMPNILAGVIGIFMIYRVARQ